MTRRRLSGNYPEFPDITDQLGYNPARFLDCSVGENSQIEERTARALIRGVQDVEHLRLWIKVEVALERGNDEPRQQVIRWINHRQTKLRDDTTSAQEREQNTDASEAFDQDEPNEQDEKTEPVETDTTDTDADTAKSVEPVEDAHHRCPDCHGELPTETVGDEDDAHWCEYCGTVIRAGVAA